MARILFTMFFANDLGLPSRLIPVARALADRGHQVAFLNPAPAPARLIADSGFDAVPCPEPPAPTVGVSTRIWDVDCLFAFAGFLDEAYVRDTTQLCVDAIGAFDPDVVVDSFSPFACLAARICNKPLVAIIQADFHPASRGFIWWEGERPADLPDAAPVFSRVAREFDQPPVCRLVDSLTGDLTLIVGTPDTDPLPHSANAIHIGPIVVQRGGETLPEWVTNLTRDRPVVWLYAGNPRYAPTPNVADSEVIIRTAIEALGSERMHVVMTSGHQPLPDNIGAVPANFTLAAYLPAIAMAKLSDVMIHHGGHGSCMTGVASATPQLIVPTLSERESNARRLAALGVARFVLPQTAETGAKQLDVAAFKDAIGTVLGDPAYRQAATRLAESAHQYGGANEAADRIERLAAQLQ